MKKVKQQFVVGGLKILLAALKENSNRENLFDLLLNCFSRCLF